MRKKKLGAALLSAMMALSLISGPVSTAQAAEKITKDETVYISQDTDGSVTEINVTDVLTNIPSSGEVKDISILEDIENTEGSELFTKGADHTLLWQAAGEDITYQGTTDAKLPVGVSFSYRLDDTIVSPSELAGKSGKIEITIKYENNSTYSDEFDGEKTTLNTPFFMLSALVMDEEIFSDIEVSQGKVVSEADTQIVLAYGMPGFIDSLKPSNDIKDAFEGKLDDTVTITAQAENFSLDAIYTIATSDVLSEIDLKDTDDLDALSDALDSMVDASDELISGSSTLTEGLNTLSSSFETYAKGINSLKDGSKSLADGTNQLSKGIKSYTDGVSTLNKGTDQYISGTNSLADGITAYINGEKELASGISTLYGAVKDFPTQYNTFSSSFLAYINGVNTLSGKENMDALTSGAGTLADSATSLNTALDALQSSYNQAYDTLNSLSQAIDGSDLSDEEKSTFQKALNSLYTLTNDGSDSQIPSIQKTAKAAGQIASGANTLKDSVSALSENATALRSSGTALKTAESGIHSAITSTVDGIKALNEGITALSAGNDALTKGAGALKTSGSELKKGLKALSTNSKLLTTSASALLKGAKQLSAGADALNKATPNISKGVSALAGGSSALTTGLKTFKEEGTRKLQNTYNENIKALLDRMKSLTGEQAKYSSYTGISEDMDGKVMFIFQTEQIKADED